MRESWMCTKELRRNLNRTNLPLGENEHCFLSRRKSEVSTRHELVMVERRFPFYLYQCPSGDGSFEVESHCQEVAFTIFTRLSRDDETLKIQFQVHGVQVLFTTVGTVSQEASNDHAETMSEQTRKYFHVARGDVTVSC